MSHCSPVRCLSIELNGTGGKRDIFGLRGGQRGWWREEGGSYRQFNIIMVHYGSESSQSASASCVRGQREYHLAVIEASVL